MKSMRKLIRAGALAVLLTGVGTAGNATATAEAAQGIRSVATVCVWEELDWNQLSNEEKRQWMVLGWNESRWESDDEAAYPASWSKDWDELGLNERSAAWLLGFTPSSWDSDESCP